MTISIVKTWRMWFFLLIVLAVSRHSEAAGENATAGSRQLLVEAESFSQHGGWVVDPQFMDQMGSPYLLAHGLGRPVPDATTDVTFPAPGLYRVWVRTKDWVAPWKAPGAPGRFQLLVEGKPLAVDFGIEGAEWHWQDGGQVQISQHHVKLALHDLTGFEGRCDAIAFSLDADFVPPNRDPEMAAWRCASLGLTDQPEAGGDYDLVVCGGGIAGTCAALSAARLGLQVALVQDRPVLGGNNSSEVRVWLQGARNKEPWPRVGDVVAELEQSHRAHYGPTNTAELYEDQKKLEVVRAEPNIHLFLEHRANAVEVDHGVIKAVIAQQTNTGRRFRITGHWFADCTGDAVIGELAAADYEMEPKGHMGPCNLWNVCECKDLNAINTDTAASSEPQPFPRCPWALDLSDKPFPGRSKLKPDTNQLGGWYWESGFDRNPITEMELIRDFNFRAMYGAWDAMKNVDKVLPNHKLNWCAFILGKRESRRLLGDVVLCLDDLRLDHKFPDGCAPTGWSNDIHLADPKFQKGFEGEAFISTAHFGEFPAHSERRPFWIPYRCLYSRNIGNLFMAGRDISTKHEALGAVRVMRTCGCEGEIVGMAASLCKKFQSAPREIYYNHLAELQELMRHGVGKNPDLSPNYENGGESKPKRTKSTAATHNAANDRFHPTGANLARTASINAPGASGLLNDGNADTNDNAGRWMGKGEMPQCVEFTWREPVTIGAARIVSGYNRQGELVSPLTDFSFQWKDGNEWKDVPGAAAEGNEDCFWVSGFAPLKTATLRLCITKTQGDIARIWEVELYAPGVGAGTEKQSGSGSR